MHLLSESLHPKLMGWAIVQNRFLRAGLSGHTFGARFLSPPESCSQGSAELIILLQLTADHKILLALSGTLLAQRGYRFQGAGGANHW
jgi:hypothetical protein